MKLLDQRVQYITLAYLTLPILIFFLSWLQPGYGVLFSGLLLIGTWRYSQQVRKQDAIDNVPAVPKRFLWVALLALAWTTASGIGGFANQDWDHHFRNALFNDLIQFKWPVYYSFPAQYKLPELANHEAALNYYLTFWLPAAVIGKIAGGGIANYVLWGWSYIGVLLVLYYLNRLFAFRYSLFVSLVFILWSGTDILGKILLQKHFPSFYEPIELYSNYIYTSFSSDLFNVFNQALPTWIVTLWMLNFRRSMAIVPIVLLLAYAPFPFATLCLFYAVYYLITTFQAVRSVPQTVNTALSDTVTVEHVMVILAVFVPYGLFYQAHTDTVPSNFWWVNYLTDSPYTNVKQVIIFLATYIFEVGLFLGAIYLLSPRTYREHKLLYWVCAILLFFLPLWVVGHFGDFASRGSIPFLTVVCVLMSKALLDWCENSLATAPIVFACGVLALAWTTPVLAILKSLPLDGAPRMRQVIVSFSNPAVTREKDEQQVYSSLMNFYAYEPRKHLFYKYLARN